MKTLSMCSIAATVIILGVIIWTLQAALMYLAWCCIAGGIAWFLVALWRHLMPAVEQTVYTRLEVKQASHEQWKDIVSLSLQERVVGYAERNHLNLEFASNGTIVASYPTRPVAPPVLPKQDEFRQEPSIPNQVRYEDICTQIPRGHALLGVSQNGVETCEFKDLMTMLISGGSSTGKSNTVAIKLHEAIQIGHDTSMIVIDPHKNKPDSLYNKIQQYEPRFLMPVANKDDAILHALTAFKNEFERRMELTTEELEGLPDILLICDEVYGLVNHRDDERIGKLIKKVSGIAGYESRGYGMYAWFLTQKVTGLKWLRDAVMTTICHKMQTMSERILASNDDREVARDMDNWTMPGRVVVFGLNLSVTVTQMPLMVVRSQERTTGALYNNPTVPDVRSYAFREPTEPLGVDVPPVPPALSDLASEHEKQRIISPEERQAIIDLALADTPRRNICRGLGKGSGYYSIVQRVLDEEGL